MSAFNKYLLQLNVRQRQAVDTIEGPVMVIAGPGTGKTTILTLRIANILKRTDTIRKALDRLTNEGFIVRHQGKGSIVKGAPKGVGILAMKGTTSAVGKENLLTRIIAGPEIRNWKEAFSFSLTRIEQESGCIYLERLRLVNNKPVFFDITMIPNINFPRFIGRNMENKSLFDVLRKNYRLEVKGGEQRILAITADERLQQYFGVPAGHPVVQLNRKIETNRPGLYLYSQVYCNTDEFMLSGTF